jgi:hypothetical protein
VHLLDELVVAQRGEVDLFVVGHAWCSLTPASRSARRPRTAIISRCGFHIVERCRMMERRAGI